MHVQAVSGRPPASRQRRTMQAIEAALKAQHCGSTEVTPRRCCRQVTVNAIAIVPRAHVGPGQRIGLAVYPAASLLNHSCIPPTAFDFQVCLLCVLCVTAPVLSTSSPNPSRRDAVRC